MYVDNTVVFILISNFVCDLLKSFYVAFNKCMRVANFIALF
jgi:hypothetical protein